MTPQTKRLVAILLAVVALWALIEVWSQPDEPPPGAGPRPTARRPGTSRPKPVVEEVVVLRSEDLERRTPSREIGRNPFRFYDPPPPPPAPPPRLSAAERAGLLGQTPVVSSLPPPTPPAPPKPQPPVIRFKYLGSFGPEGAKIAVFLDGETTINARVGETVLGKFRVAKIGYESADIEFVDFPDAPAQRLPVGR